MRLRDLAARRLPWSLDAVAPAVGDVLPGLADVMWGLLPVLNRLRLIDGNDAEYTITGYGEWVLIRLDAPAEETS